MKVYLAGGFFNNEDDWRYDLVKGLMAEPPKVQYRSAYKWGHLPNAVLDCIDYVGPFPDKHLEENPFLLKWAIEEADIVFAWADEYTYNSEIAKVSAEIAYADALGKLPGIGSTWEGSPSLNDIWVADSLGSFFPFHFIAPTPKEALVECLQSLLPFMDLEKQAQLSRKNNWARQVLCQNRLNRFGYIYLIKAETGQYKIGRSTNVPKRMNLFSVKLPFRFDIIHVFPADNAHDAESRLHKYFESKRTNGEWFNLQPSDEGLLRRVICFKHETFNDKDKLDMSELGWETQEEVEYYTDEEFYALISGPDSHNK